MNLNEIFEDGVLKGVHLIKQSGTRPLSLNVTRRGKIGVEFSTSYSVNGVDFPTVWKRVVDTLADHYDIPDGSDLYRMMIESRTAFMQKFGLRTRIVKIAYSQVEFE
jgi:hypothetical protein